MNLHVKFTWAKSDEREMGISGVTTKGRRSIFLFLFFLDISIEWAAKDWILRGADEVIGGKVYQVWTKNPKYENCDVHTFIFPRT